MLEIRHVWVIAGFVLWIVEIFTPGFLLGVFGLACLIVAPFASMDVTFKVQLLIFSIATAILFLFIRPLIIRFLYNRESDKITTNVDALVGMSALVTEMIDNASGTGRVKLAGEFWRAVTSDNSQIEAGQKVIVRGVDGCKLIVELIS